MKTKQQQKDEVFKEYNLEWSRLDEEWKEAITPVRESYEETSDSIAKVYEDSIRNIVEIRNAKLKEIEDKGVIILNGKKYRLEE